MQGREQQQQQRRSSSLYCSRATKFYSLVVMVAVANIVAHTYYYYTHTHELHSFVQMLEILYSNRLNHKPVGPSQPSTMEGVETIQPPHSQQPDIDSIQLDEWPVSIDRLQLAIQLANNESPGALNLEYFTLNSSYNLDSPVEQRRMCMVLYGRNLLQRGREAITHTLASINKQNYSNYQVLLVDDGSTDGTHDYLQGQLTASFPRLNNRLTLISNRQAQGRLGSTDWAIRHHCQPGDIVIDASFDLILVGRQVFNTINRVYQAHPAIWFTYSNYLEGVASEGNLTKLEAGQGQQIADELFRHSNHRALLAEQHIGPLRSYLLDLYLRIPPSHFLEPRSLSPYLGGGRFIDYALMELAGPQRCFYFGQHLALHLRRDPKKEEYSCELQMEEYSRVQAKMLKPFTVLQSLESEPRTLITYQIDKPTMVQYLEKEMRLFSCIKAHRSQFQVL